MRETVIQPGEDQPEDSHDRVSTSSPSSKSDDREALIAALERRDLNFWMDAVSSSAAGSAHLHALQQSVSWRITKPIRLVRGLQLKASQVGYRKAVTVGVDRLKRARLDRARDR